MRTLNTWTREHSHTRDQHRKDHDGDHGGNHFRKDHDGYHGGDHCRKDHGGDHCRKDHDDGTNGWYQTMIPMDTTGHEMYQHRSGVDH